MTEPTTPPRPRPPPLTVQFFLRHGAIVTWPVPRPQDFSLLSMTTAVRAQGFFIADDLYIPADEIALIGISGGPSTVKQPTMPQHTTKQ